VRWSLAHLHPATVANMVNFGLSHNAHTNRLFWRVDENTLIGRFYLMHMVGIRPEVTDFVVGSSCDYSFIPEMCPSGNVIALTDSDDYLVVEMQPREHESKWLLPGPIEPRLLADSLSEWTTAQHRGNVANTLVYHAAEIPAQLAPVVAEADAYIDQVRALLSPEPHPHRHHHYWIGSIASNRARTRRPLNKEDWQFLLGEAMPSAGLTATLWRLRAKLFGSAPDVTQLHPRWPDYGLPLEALKKIIAEKGRTLLVSQTPDAFARWLTRSAGEIVTLESERLLDATRDLYLPLVESFDACLIILSEGLLARADQFIARAGPLLKPGGRIMLMVTNERGLALAADFGREFAHHSARLLDLSAWVGEIRYIPASRIRWAIYRAMGRVQRRGDTLGWRSPARLALLAMAAAPLTLATYLTNLGTRATATPPPGLWSSVFLILRPAAAGHRPPLPSFTSDRDADRRAGASTLVAASGARAPGKVDDVEPARAASGVSGHDPARLAQALARYRLVADLLAPHQDSAEYGCGEGLGLAMVLRKVRKITLYDPDPIALADLHGQFPDDAPVAARTHDILSGPLPRLHDAIYSLDTIRHVSPNDEDLFVQHLRDSLINDHGVLIIGSPSVGADASPMDVRTFPRSAAELKALSERHFHVVFSFSMVDDVVRPGIFGSAEYAFALCCCRKSRT
jgi:hypothetical protein